MKIYELLLKTIKTRGAAYLVLIDPDNFQEKKLAAFIKYCDNAGVDGFLTGGSLLLNNKFEECLTIIKENTSLPLIIFPGNIYQISGTADAILFLSAISGRNADDLIGKHVTAAPVIRNAGIEVISTGYILIDSGAITSVQYFSSSLPIPSDKPDIAAATALAGEYIGMKLIYLEAGSGAVSAVPDKMVKAVSSYSSLPVIVGGGIKDPQTARDKVVNGAGIIVTGNFFEDENNWYLIKEFAKAIHIKEPVEV
jgi:phosphoglycerol geranylgeranyltransferase